MSAPVPNAGTDIERLLLIREIEEMSDQEWTSKAPYAAERRNRLVTQLGSVLGAPKRPFVMR